MTKKTKGIIIGALPSSLLNFRGLLIEEMVARDIDITVMASDEVSSEVLGLIRKIGAKYRGFPVCRNGINPFQDLRTYQSLKRSLKSIEPDFILAYTIKPIIWGALASRVVPGNRFYALVTGLGYTFAGTTPKRRLLRFAITKLFKTSLNHAQRVIFQNSDDREIFEELGIISRSKAEVVNGSGVDLNRFSFQEPPAGNLVFLMIARLLGEKGVREYAFASNRLKVMFPNASFKLIGPFDSSPDGISREEFSSITRSGGIEYLGEQSDVRPFLKESHVFVLPSYHEGMPRTVLEAMAVGRPIITTEARGCKDTVTDGLNGWLVPIRDRLCLQDRMQWFIEHPTVISVMGAASRKLAEEKFDVRKVNQKILSILQIHE